MSKPRKPILERLRDLVNDPEPDGPDDEDSSGELWMPLRRSEARELLALIEPPRGKCGRRYHAADCECGGEGGDR